MAARGEAVMESGAGIGKARGERRRGRRKAGRDEMEAQAEEAETRMERVVVPFAFGFDFFSFCYFALFFPLISYLNLCDCSTLHLHTIILRNKIGVKLDRNMLLLP